LEIAAYSVDVWERGCAKMANRTGRYGEVRCRRFSALSMEHVEWDNPYDVGMTGCTV